MGLITNSNNSFIPAEYIYSKVKRDFKSFASVNLIDDQDFPNYTMEVLRELGNSALKETEAVVIIKDRQALLPKDFEKLYAAYRCKDVNQVRHSNKLLQNKIVFETSETYDILCPQTKCEIEHHLPDDKVLTSRLIIRQYVNENYLTHEYDNFGLLRVSPNVRPYSEHHHHHTHDLGATDRDITINDGYIFTTFDDDAIYLQYYAYPFDESGLPLIPNNKYVEKAVENYIKWQLLLNFWIVDDVANVMQKAQYYQMEYNESLAEAKHDSKLPTFEYLVNFLRNTRGISKVDFFSNQFSRR